MINIDLQLVFPQQVNLLELVECDSIVASLKSMRKIKGIHFQFDAKIITQQKKNSNQICIFG
jgi:hypothetical protein